MPSFRRAEASVSSQSQGRHRMSSKITFLKDETFKSLRVSLHFDDTLFDRLICSRIGEKKTHFYGSLTFCICGHAFRFKVLFCFSLNLPSKEFYCLNYGAPVESTSSSELSVSYTKSQKHMGSACVFDLAMYMQFWHGLNTVY